MQQPLGREHRIRGIFQGFLGGHSHRRGRDCGANGSDGGGNDETRSVGTVGIEAGRTKAERKIHIAR